MKLKVPNLKGVPFETAIIERYRRRESSVEEALIEMYLAGVSVRRMEDITEALWGTKVSPGTISNLNKKHMDTLKTGVPAHYPVSIHTSMWMVYISNEAGAGRSEMFLSLLPSASAVTDSGRSSVLRKE